MLLLPKCSRKVVLLDFAKEHAQSYNDLVELIRNNLLMTDWWDDEHHEVCARQESTLHATNMRAMCSVCSHNMTRS